MPRNLKTNTFFSDGCNTYFLQFNIDSKTITFELKDTISFFRSQAENRDVVVDLFEGRLYLYLNGISSIVEIDLVKEKGCFGEKRFMISSFKRLTIGGEYIKKYRIIGKLKRCGDTNWDKIVDFLEKN